MAIQLVKEQEKRTYENGGSKIYYRRVPSPRHAAVVKKHTKKGRTDWAAVADELLLWAILGWEGVKDGGQVIAFDKELIALLPSEVRTDLIELTGTAGPDAGDEAAPGNS